MLPHGLAAAAYVSYGRISDLWGLSLTPADINASTFGVAISAQNIDAKSQNLAYINHIRMTVYFGLAEYFPVD